MRVKGRWPRGRPSGSASTGPRGTAGRGRAGLRELTGLQDIRPHDFRRTGRTHISGLEVRDEVAEALLNHAKEEVNGTYNLYTYWRERKEALKLWHAKLERLRAHDVPEAA